MTQYNKRIDNAISAGFEIYVETFNENGRGVILTNTKKDSPYNGEVLDIFEDGTYEKCSQFKDCTSKYIIS